MTVRQGEMAFCKELIDWICPVCDWLMSDMEHRAIKVDVECQGCGCRNISEYIPCAIQFPEGEK